MKNLVIKLEKNKKKRKTIYDYVQRFPTELVFFFSNNFRKFKKFVDSKTDLLLYVKRELKLINSI